MNDVCRGAAAGAPPPRAALLGAIQGGARLRKATTIDRSIPPGAGHVLQASPSSGQQDGPSGRSSPAPTSTPASGTNAKKEADDDLQNSQTASTSNAHRQSVDWYGALAADRYPSPTVPHPRDNTLPNVVEEREEAAQAPAELAAPVSAQIVDSEERSGSENEAEDPNTYFDMTSCKPFRICSVLHTVSK